MGWLWHRSDRIDAALLSPCAKLPDGVYFLLAPKKTARSGSGKEEVCS